MLVRAAEIKILAPQKLAKDCLPDVGFSPFLTKNKTMLVRFTHQRKSLRKIHQRRHRKFLVQEYQEWLLLAVLLF
jgi:hypothetical protein